MRRSVVSTRVVALSIAISLALVALTISGVIVATASGKETRSLTSSADTQIVENAPTKNYGSATSLGVNENDQSSIGKDKFALVKWDLSGIAPRTQINSAIITLNVTNSSPETYQAYVLKKPWVESEATWNVYSSGEPWEVAGAKGSLDKEATVAGSITPSVKGKNTLPLPLAVVQDWVDNPDTNQGIIIAYPSSTRGFNFNSREDTDPTQRPQLTLDLIPDTAPPETTIDMGPAEGATLSSGDASFMFSSNEAGSTYECSLDNAAYTACTSPKEYTDLSEGSHTFSVKATDAAGNTEASPASTTWMVDTTAPETTIDSGPSGTISVAEATFAYSSEDGSTFECSLNGAPYSACTSPKTKSYTKLSNGSHTFDVRAIDGAGNVDATPASRTFSVEVPPPPQGTTPPETTIDSGPSGTVNSSSAMFNFSSSEPNSTFECSIDGGGFASCTSPESYTALTDGSHSFQVKATDAVGNTDGSPASWSWTSDATPPTISTVEPADGATGVGATSNVEAAFSEAMNSSTIDGSTFTLAKQGSTTPVAAQVTYDPVSRKATLDPDAGLEADTTYTATLKGGTGGVKDDAGNPLAEDETWSFTTAAASPPADTIPPETTIDSGSSDMITVDSATFTFSSSEAGATFECSLDGAAYSACTSPKDYTNLSNGFHTFDVRATDGAGNVDATPASRTFSVEVLPPPPPDETTPPETTIDSGPSGTLSSSSASFAFSSDEAGSTFECKLDAGTFAPCTSPQAYDGLSNGSHTFEVRATDAAGNYDASPASRTWTVDTTTPETTIDSGPAEGATLSSGDASFAFSSSDEAGSTFECQLDGEPFSACVSPKSYTALAAADHTFSVRARDAAGNVDDTPAMRNFSVQVAAPPRVNVTAFGATANDASNDSAAFEDAFAATGPGEVTYVPSGTFRLATVNIPSNTDVQIESSATLKKFGTTQGPLFKIRGPTDTSWKEYINIEGVNGDFVMDLNDAGQETGAFTFLDVRHFSLKHAICIQNNDNQTQGAPSSRRPCLYFAASQTAAAGGVYQHPTDGLVEDVHSLMSPYGWGLVQTSGGQDLTFRNISSEGGVPLRLENYSNGWTPMKNITADGVTCKNGHDAVHMNPHGAAHLGNIHISGVVADSCESAISLAGDGTYGPNVTIDNVDVFPGITAQIRDPAKTQYVAAWLIGNSKYCIDDRAQGWTVQLTNLRCGGLPNN